MAPCCDLKTRVWACLLLHTAGYQGELAQVMKKGKNGPKVVPMRIPDVVKELRKVEQEYYQEAGIESPAATSDWNLRRAFRELEQDGICERRLNGKPVLPESNLHLQTKEIQIYVWFEPHKPERQIVKRTRIRQEPVPVQTGLFDRRILRQIEKLLPTDDPRVAAYLKLAQSDTEHAQEVAKALARAAVLFNESLPLGEIQIVKSDLGATKKGKVGPGRHEKSDLGATKQAPHTKEETNTETLKAASAAVSKEDEVAKKDELKPKTEALPATVAEIQKHDPATGFKFANRVFQATFKNCPTLTDDRLALCVKESYATGPKNHGAGLLLHRVPEIAATLAAQEWKESPPPGKKVYPSVFDVFPQFRKNRE